jgi:prevent-host-death family protein
MQAINISYARTHLSQLFRRALAGEKIVIGRAGHPQVVLVPYRPATCGKGQGKVPTLATRDGVIGRYALSILAA